jgi:hypothetical protein
MGEGVFEIYQRMSLWGRGVEQSKMQLQINKFGLEGTTSQILLPASAISMII